MRHRDRSGPSRLGLGALPLLASLLAGVVALAAPGRRPSAQQQGPVFRAIRDMVLVDVVVRDRSGDDRARPDRGGLRGRGGRTAATGLDVLVSGDQPQRHADPLARSARRCRVSRADRRPCGDGDGETGRAGGGRAGSAAGAGSREVLLR